MSSDACTGSHDPVTLELVDARGARNPAIFGHALGFCFRFPLEGEWRRVHITITEALGPALGALILAPLLPYAKFPGVRLIVHENGAICSRLCFFWFYTLFSRCFLKTS